MFSSDLGIAPHPQIFTLLIRNRQTSITISITHDRNHYSISHYVPDIRCSVRCLNNLEKFQGWFQRIPTTRGGLPIGIMEILVKGDALVMFFAQVWQFRDREHRMRVSS